MKKLLKVLKYNKHSGIFTWLISPQQGIKINTKAGSLCSNGYIYICYKGKRYLAHRLAWFFVTGSIPKNEIDHKDRIRNNNIFTNLRDVTKTENARNTNAKGVTFEKDRNKYKAQIMVNRKQIYLGRYCTYKEAELARKKAEIKYFN